MVEDYSMYNDTFTVYVTEDDPSFSDELGTRNFHKNTMLYGQKWSCDEAAFIWQTGSYPSYLFD